MNLAERLLKAGVLTPEQLAPALYQQRRNRAFLSKHLLDLKIVEPEVLKPFLHPDPPIPETLEDIGFSQTMLIQLLLKHAYYRDTFSTQEMSRDIKIVPKLLEPLIAYLKAQNLLFARPRDLMGNPSHLSMEMYYALTDQGRASAEQALEDNRYAGPAPVSLDDYWDWAKAGREKPSAKTREMDKKRWERKSNERWIYGCNGCSQSLFYRAQTWP